MGRMNNLEKNLNENVIRIIEWEIIRIERQNAKSHEKKDADMVNEIVDIIKKEVDRIKELPC